VIFGLTGEDLLLELQTDDELAGLFPQVSIFDGAGSVFVGPLNLADRGGGLYQVDWSSPTAGQFSARFLTYTNVGHTVRSDHEPVVEHLRVEDWKGVVDAILSETAADHIVSGSVGEALLIASAHAGLHVRDDALTYDANNRPLTLRRRIFADKTGAEASTAGGTGEGEIITLTIDASHIDAARWQSLLRRR
jgi:hypothetical protein